MKIDCLSPVEASRVCGLSAQKIRRLIELGRLPATDTSTGQRPRWSIRREDLEAFLTPRNLRPEARRTAPPRRKRLDANVPKVF